MAIHVLIVARGIPSEQSPLNGIFEWDQAMALSNEGVEVDYFAIDLRSLRRIRPWGIRHGEKDGIRWHSISIPVGAIPLGGLCKIGAMALRILYRKSFKKANHVPDIIHAHFTEIGHMATELAKVEKLPLVITEHSSKMIQPIISDTLKRIAKKAYYGATCVIAVSSSLKNRIYQHTGVVAEAVPNIVANEYHYGKCEHVGMKFVSVATLTQGKRIDVLLRAFERLSAIYRDVTLEIVGDGEQRDSLQELAEELHISNKVRFHGTLARQDIDALYKRCDCFVLPSAFETFGVAYIEAMAAGLPVIATRCGGPKDFVTEENGILVDIDDVEGLKNAMLNMYLSRKQYDGSAIAANTAARFSASAVAKRILNIYNKVLDEKGLVR